MIPHIFMRCLGLKRSTHDDQVDQDEEMAGDVQGALVPSTVSTTHSGLDAQEEAYHPKNYVADVKEEICIRKEERVSENPCARKSFGPRTQPMKRIGVQGDSWVLHSSGSCKQMAQRSDASQKGMEFSSKLNKNASQSKTTTRRPSQMTQEIIKLKEQYEALQSSFKHLNQHLSPSPSTLNDTPKKKRDAALRHSSTPLRPVQENRARVQAFRPQDSSGTAANPRQRSTLPSQQSHVRHSFRNTEIIRCVYIYRVNAI